MTQAPAKQELWLFTGTVTAVNEKGLKLDSFGDDWLNYTKPEWRGSWYDVSKGEHVTIQCEKWKDTYFVKTIVLDGHQNFDEPELPPTGAPATNRDLSIIRQVCIKAAANAAVAFIGQRCYIDPDGEPMTETVAIDIAAMAQTLERWAVRAE